MKILLKPFKENLWLFLVLYLLASSAQVYFYIHDARWLEAADYACRGFLLSWCLAFICGLFQGKPMKMLETIFITLGVLNLALDKGTYNICHTPVSLDTVGLIFGTNSCEISEFFKTYVTLPVVIFIVLVLVACALCILFKGKLTTLSKYLVWPLGVVGVGSLLFLSCCRLPKNENEISRWESVFLCKASLFARYEKTPDLDPYRHDLLVSTSGPQPDNIVLVIGESLAKSHCSLYGYGRETQPRLRQLGDSLIVFSDAKSAWYNTVPSIKMMLSEWDDSEGGGNWYEAVTLFDVAKAAGYRTEWISNQSSAGIADNPVAAYASLADTTIWLGQRGVGKQKQDYDGIVVEKFRDRLGEVSTGCKTLYIIHLMGCHESFAQRYPAMETCFEADDYQELPENQRLAISQYDNAVRYNDAVMGELLDLISNTESVLLYLPDHGLDLYVSSPDYYGHARMGDDVSVAEGVKVPMIMYMSSAYRERFPSDCQFWTIRSTEAFNSKNLIPLCCDLMKIDSFSQSTENNSTI